MRMRRYRLSDIDEMIVKTEEYCKTHPFYSRLPFSEKKLRMVLTDNIDNEQFYCNIVEDKGEIIAGLAACFNGYAIAEGNFAEDIIGYVRPGFRGSKAFDDLLDGYIKWGMAYDKVKIFDIRCTYTGDKGAAFERYVKKHGMKRFGSMYVLNLVDGE